MMYGILTIILFILMAYFGGKRGVRSFSVLLFNTAIAGLSIMLIVLGFSVIAIGLVSSLAFSLLTLYYQNGINRKTTAALISVMTILCLVGGIILAVINAANITGLNEIELEEGNNFMGYAIPFRLFPILILSILWGELGAVTDTALSVSSAMQEINSADCKLSFSLLIAKGMSVGRDILGTTVNTLTFIALGEALMLFVYYNGNGYSAAEVINSKSFFQGIGAVIFSCIGCVLVIPVTALIFAYLTKRSRSCLQGKTRKDIIS